MGRRVLGEVLGFDELFLIFWELGFSGLIGSGVLWGGVETFGEVCGVCFEMEFEVFG